MKYRYKSIIGLIRDGYEVLINGGPHMLLDKAARTRRSPRPSNITDINYMLWNFASAPLTVRYFGTELHFPLVLQLLIHAALTHSARIMLT
jgi:phosphate starvation-inducible membrane PsiE